MRTAYGWIWISALAAVLGLAACDSSSPAAGDARAKDARRDTGQAQPDGGPLPDSGTPPDALPPDAPFADLAPGDGPQTTDVFVGDAGPLPSDAALADIVFVDAAPPPPGCGDGVRGAGEECDDGNTTNLDGCSSGCRFEQVQRINKLTIELAAAPFCGANAFGSAIAPLAVGQVQGALDASIKDGSMTVLLQFLGLDSLDGADDPLLTVGVMGGEPAVTAGYDGRSDLDWWYKPNAAHINGARVPLTQLNATISGKMLVAGPASLVFPLSFGASPSQLKLSHARLRADIGATSKPLVSTGSAPGHLASEQLDPALVSFQTAGQTSGLLCGRIPAASLALMPIPDTLTAGAFACSEGYTASNTLLDMFVGGCTVIIVKAINPTAPDSEDPDAPAAGAGAPYTLVRNTTTRAVDSCKDRNGQTVSFTACLADAAYTAYFSIGAGRVIAR